MGKRLVLPPLLLAKAREMRKISTTAEKFLWSLLRNRQLHKAKFRRQHPIGNYILDFYCHESHLAVELDGSGHGEPEQQELDMQRTEWLNNQSIRVIRFWNNEVLENIQGVLQRIAEALIPLPNPLPKGEGAKNIAPRLLYEYETPTAEPHVSEVPNISPYLISAGNTLVQARSTPLCNVPELIYGSMANDGGNLLLNSAEKVELVAKEPRSEKFLRRLYGSQEFINNEERWCLWLKDVLPSDLRAMPEVMRRVEAVRKHRLKSIRKATQDLAAFATLFGEIRHVEAPYLLVPGVSSERRVYIPIGFMPKDTIATDLCRILPNATLYHFGVLSSLLHITWVKHVCGRLKSDYRYSNTIVYNNFPWAESPTDAQKQAVERSAQAVLDARSAFPQSSLADLYDPLTMPPALVKAHQDLDRAVEKCYRAGKAFASDEERITLLFELYEKYTAPLTAEAQSKKQQKNKARTRQNESI